MNKVILTILLTILTLVIIALGFLIGVFYQTQQSAPIISKINDAKILLENLNSKVVVAVVASGKVASISGRNITVLKENESLLISVKDTARILKVVPIQGSLNNSLQRAYFEDIKKGDYLNIQLKVLSSGQLEAESVSIVAPPT